MPLFFAGRITETALLLQGALAFVAFSFIASTIYIINDYRDIEEDRRHPQKSKRPLASGTISKPKAISIAGIMAIVGFWLMYTVDPHALLFLTIYMLMNIAYSFRLKHIAILDVTIIAIGFVLRLFIGSDATGIPLSMWIVVMTFLLAMFLALAKRRDDVLIFLETGQKMRKVINGYNLQFLDTAMAIMASVVIVAYTIYTTSVEVTERFSTEYLYLTAIFVIMGIMRYLQLAFVLHESGSPTKIVFQDSFMQIVLLGWVISFALIIY